MRDSKADIGEDGHHETRVIHARRRWRVFGAMSLSAFATFAGIVVSSCGNTGVGLSDGGGDSGRLPNGTFCARLRQEPSVSTSEYITLCSPDAAEDSPCFVGTMPRNQAFCRSVDRFNPTQLGPYVANNRVPKLCWVPPAPNDNGGRGKGPACFTDAINQGGSQLCGTSGLDGTFCLFDADRQNGRCMPLPYN